MSVVVQRNHTITGHCVINKPTRDGEAETPWQGGEPGA
jgi:hypothetical protein